MARCFVGTAGWSYDSWVGDFYPTDLTRDRWLEYYAERLATVELNATFYRMPSADTFKTWAKRVPRGFKFAVKASRFITHTRRLDVDQSSVDLLMGRARLLGPKLGPVLYQLPPKWRCDPERLDKFAELLPGRVPSAFEFRDKSWFDDRVYKAMRKRRLSFCIFHMPDQESPLAVTARVVYIRFHGASGMYRGSYAHRLAKWADRIRGWMADGHDVYAYFNNTGSGEAATDAMKLREMLAQ
ncbi:MAG: DUF72 domain-containing protein [Chloroflexi bacterium]|nr:DUF72 domain-containing protein [Chloroflexota bacterium]